MSTLNGAVAFLATTLSDQPPSNQPPLDHVIPNILPSVELPAPSCANDRDQAPPFVVQKIRLPAEPPHIPLVAPTTPLINTLTTLLDHTSATPPDDAQQPAKNPISPASNYDSQDDDSSSSSASELMDILGK